MKFFSVVAILLVTSSVFAAPFGKNAIKLSPKTRQALAGCNANVCFALSGSSPITPQQFRQQQDFVFNVIAAIQKDELEAAAIQYGVRPDIISPLTSNELDFFLKVDQASFANYSINFLSGGIIGCQRELANRPGIEANKIILITDGRSTFGGNPSTASRLFRETGGEICAIGIGFDEKQADIVLRPLVENENDIFTLQEYIQLGQLVDTMVQRICH